jgi:hypothetical protein
MVSLGCNLDSAGCRACGLKLRLELSELDVVLEEEEENDDKDEGDSRSKLCKLYFSLKLID